MAVALEATDQIASISKVALTMIVSGVVCSGGLSLKTYKLFRPSARDRPMLGPC